MFPMTGNYYTAVNPGINSLEGLPKKAVLVGTAMGYSLTAVADLAAGTILNLASIVTAGIFTPLNKKAMEITGSGALGLLALPYSNILNAVNPAAECDDTQSGIVAPKIRDKLFERARELSYSEGFIERHIFSRLAFFGFGLLALATRVVDLAIGLLAAPLSLIACGKSKQLNSWAVAGLVAPVGIDEVCVAIIKTINPQAAFR